LEQAFANGQVTLQPVSHGGLDASFDFNQATLLSLRHWRLFEDLGF
jgi:hypothetical protein